MKTNSEDVEADSPKSENRPVSFYDNFLDEENTFDPTRYLNVQESHGDNDVPTQAHCLSTTVPQNIASQKLGGKHTPTRNSLRHSRMIVLNRNGRVPRKYLPTIIRYHKLAKSIMGLITLLGSALCFLSVWLLIWTPNLRQRDNTYYSAIPVLFSGILGLILLCCCRKEYPGSKRNYCVYTVKMLSISSSTISAVATFTACAFSIIHLTSLSVMDCSPLDELNSTCYCKFNESSSVLPIKSYHYIDLNCPEVHNVLTILLIFSCGTNLFAGLLEVWYLCLHWSSRFFYTYSKVRVDENTTTIYTHER